MDEQPSLSKSKYNEFHENIINGDDEKINKLINNGINIYKRTSENETSLHLALLNQHSQIAAILWNIYKNDLKLVQQSLQDSGDQFWTKKPIFIVYGAENISSFTELYVEYKKCENKLDVYDKNKCVVFLLKRDSLTPEKVLRFTPKSEIGIMLTIRMIKCVLSNGVLDLQAQSDYHWTLIDASAKAGAGHIFNDLVNFGIESNHTNIVLKAIQYGHVEFLDMFYRKFPTHIYEFFRSFCLRILGSNKWSVFKYYAEKIIAEKQFTWTQIVNYRLPFRNLTVFHDIIKHDLTELAERLVEYDFNFDVKDIKGRSLLLDLKWNYTFSELYQCIVMKIIESDPTQLQIVYDNHTICHKLVSGFCLPDLVQFFTKYPDAKKIFFKSQDVAFKFISDMISREQFDTTKYLVGNSDDHLDKDLLYDILNHLTRVNNIELFVYVMSLAEYDFTIPTTQKEYPIVTALENHNLEIFKMIWKKVENNNLSHLFYDLLRCAIQKPDYNQLFDEILEKCSDLKNLQEHNKSLFHWSAIANNLHTAKELIKRDVTIELEYTEGSVCDVLLPTYYAKTVEMYKLLEAHTLEVDRFSQQLENQFTPLHNCMTHQPSDETIKLIEYLIENGCDIDEEDDKRRPCIYYAKKPDIAKCLLKFNPSLNCIDENALTPIQYAFITNRPNVAYVMLEDESVDYSIPNNYGGSYLRHLVTEQYNYGDLNEILSNMNSRLRTYLVEHCNDSSGHGSPIIFGALKSNVILSNLLLNQPSLNLFVHDIYNRNTILHVAMLYERVDTVDFLIERGLKVNEQNVDGDTPLNVYCRFSVDICEKVLRRYLKHNPDVRIKNKRGMSPILYVATKDKTGEAVCELIAHGASLRDIDPENSKIAFDKLTVRVQEMFKFLMDK